MKELEYVQNVEKTYYIKNHSEDYQINICVMAIGSPRWQSRRAFTQYFLDNPEKIKEYSDVKIRSIQLANELKNMFPLPKTVEEYTKQRDKQFNECIKNKEGYG